MTVTESLHCGSTTSSQFVHFMENLRRYHKVHIPVSHVTPSLPFLQFHPNRYVPASRLGRFLSVPLGSLRPNIQQLGWLWPARACPGAPAFVPALEAVEAEPLPAAPPGLLVGESGIPGAFLPRLPRQLLLPVLLPWWCIPLGLVAGPRSASATGPATSRRG